VEERKYEFAMLRTLGLRNRNLIVLMAIQSVLFSVPGIVNLLLNLNKYIGLRVFSEFYSIKWSSNITLPYD
jgi:ABC-type lipoprotein release transport system permease subunit